MSIVLDKIVKRYDGSNVVDECNLEVADGELFVLLGASGSGKSTILRLIAGLLPVDSGQILLHGRRVDMLPPQARDVGFVFQNYSLFRHMTIAENIEFGLRIRGKARKDRRRRSDELLEVVGLSGLGERYPSQLSGGQMQRVALARALAYEPAVLLLDEPFGALDVKIRAQLRQSLRAIQRTLKVTTILVTHDQDEAFELGDRIGVMERGRLLEIGRPEDLYRAPKSEYVATFLGSGNVIAGRVEEGRIRLGKIGLELPASLGETPSGAAVSVLCRPEELIVSSEASGLTGILLGRAKIVERVFAGPSERLYLRCEDLRGAHAIVPAPAYGEDSPILQALARPDFLTRPATVGDEVFVALRSYHVFKHPGMRLLLCSNGSEPSISFGLTLARALDGPVTLIGVGEDEHERRLLHNWLEEVIRLQGGHGAGITVATRLGVPADEILAELEEHPYELCVLGTAAGGAEIGRTAARVAQELRVPVLIVPAARPAVRRILICTAVGEPGKADIEFGGRIARRSGASVTILHVRPQPEPSAAPSPELRPAEAAHLEKGLVTLGRLTVAGQVKVRRGAVVPEIFAEAESGDYDLIVIGAHHSGGGRPNGARPGMLSNDIANAIVTQAKRPVLMVPMRVL